MLSPTRFAWRVVVVMLLWLWQLPGDHQALEQESLAAMAGGDLEWVNGTDQSDMLKITRSARAGLALTWSGLLQSLHWAVPF